MKKFLTLVVALVMVIPMMAIGRNDGSTKANAINFSWDSVMTHSGGTKWYHVDLAPLYEEESPALNLFLANKDAFSDAHTSLKATVAGQTDEKSFTIHPKQQRVWSANATMLIRLKQKEIYLTLTSDREVKLSARVFEAQDLDETCTDALYFNWGTGITKPAGVPVWYKVSIKEAKANTAQDVCVVVTNNGSKKLTLFAGQSLDCPSSGVTRRTLEIAGGQTLRDTIPNSMLNGVAFDELYVSLENDQPITVTAEYANRPPDPVMPGDTGITPYTEKVLPIERFATDTMMYKRDTMLLLAGQEYLLKYDVKKLNALKKYEPEFTFRNTGAVAASVERKMSFEVPAYVAQGNTLELAAGEESIEVLKKNTLLGLDNDTIYVKIKTNQNIQLISRFKHLREGKACKTNIDYNWAEGNHQDAKTTQWYAIDLSVAKATVQDVIVHVENQNASAAAHVTASLAFSCPYIDVQELSRTIAAGDTAHRRVPYSTYAMMTDTVWMGIETDQNIKFWATLAPAEKKAEVDSICLQANDFDWEKGELLEADTTVWYAIDMTKVRNLAAKFPTVFVQNLSSTDEASITGELSLECPDSIANEKRTMKIAANGAYSKQLSRNMFENITKPVIYLKVRSTQQIKIQIRLTEEAEGASCSSAIPFNWTSGNTQNANENVWYSVDLRDVMKNGNNIELHIKNRDNAQCQGVAQLIYECPSESAPSVQNFKLAALAEKTIHVQNSAFEAVNDSIVYVNLQGTTGLRFWVVEKAAKPFDTIEVSSIAHFDTLYWDSLYTQTADTVWYIIPTSEILRIKNMDEKVKPVAHIWNNGTSEASYKAEAAFAFPIVKAMMSKTQKLKAGKHFADTIPSGTFDQLLKKALRDPSDSVVYIRMTRTKGSGTFQFKSELVKAFSGNSRTDALPIRLGERYTQGVNTEMWYKLKTADIKKDKTLYNKQLFVNGRNAGKGDAKVHVEVYEGLLSEEDLLEAYGLNEYRERTIKKGQGKSHNVPAQAVYAVADVELYIKVRTTDSLVFETKFVGEYKPQTPDPKQQEAKLVVPNVDYVIPGDNQEHWYLVCVPYINANDSKDGKIKRNYKYVEESYLHYELSGKATIEATATFQDTMNCAMPVRKRTINKSGKNYAGDKPLRELIERGLKKAGHPFDFSGTAPEFIDSLLHRFITQDSITGYVRVKSDKEIKVRLNTPQITGDRCDNAMMFDWEHGNVNAKDSDTWYQVILINPDSTLRIPDTCDIRIHVDNWSDSDNTIDAGLFFDCNETATVTKHYVMPAGGKDSIDVDRDRLELLKANMLINFVSTGAAHIWAEFIDTLPRQILDTTIDVYECYGGTFIDTVEYKAIQVEKDTSWTDTVQIIDGVMIKDSLTTFNLHPIKAPAVVDQDSLKKLNAAPLLVQGMQLYVKASNDSLMAYYKKLALADTIFSVDTVYWAKPVYKSGGDLDTKKEAPLDTVKYYTKTDLLDTLLLVIKDTTHCNEIVREAVVFTIDPYKYAPKNDTVCPPLPAKNPDTLTYATPVPEPLYYNRLRYVDTVVTYLAKIQPALYAQAQINPSFLPNITAGKVDTTYTVTLLKQQFEDDATPLTMKVTDISWQVNNGTAWQEAQGYAVPSTAANVTLRYLIEAECGVKDTSENIIIANPPAPCVNDTVWMTTPVRRCSSYKWDKNNQTYTATGKYYYDATDEPVGTGCHKVYELNLIIDQPTDGEDYKTICANELPYTWKGIVFTKAGSQIFDTLNVAGCDSTITLYLIVKDTTTGDEYVTICAKELPYTWKGQSCAKAGTYTFDTLNVAGCDSTVTLHLTVNSATTGDVYKTICDSELPYAWKDQSCAKAGTYTFDTLNVAGCDSTITLHLTVLSSTTGDEYVTICANELPYSWKGQSCAKAGTYTFDTLNVAKCDSTITLHLTVNPTYTMPTEKVTSCNLYEWHDVIYTESGIYYDSLTTKAGCDSVYVLDLTINGIPFVDSLDIKAYYGYRIIMINRTQVNDKLGWTLDSLDTEHSDYVTWHSIDLNGNDEPVWQGYYYTLPSGDPLPTGYQFYATIDVPASVNAKCGVQARTKIITIGATSAAPALIPSLAKPGEDIQVVNLDPTVETQIRIFTAEGLLQKTYKSSGETSFTIKAASDLGFYLVELSADSMKSTLRYIVK